MKSLRNQQGSTLIIVLLLLVVITIIGTMAVRQSLLSLRIATNGQVQQLLLQSSDSAYFNIEEEGNLIRSFLSNGMFNAIDGSANKNKELVFCYLGDKEEFFDIARSSIIEWRSGQTSPTNNSVGMNGYCSTANSSTNFFTSGRRAVMTQVAVKYSTITAQDPFYGMQMGTDEEGNKFQTSKLVKVFTVSLMPTLTNVSSAQVDICLNSRMNEVTIPSGTIVSQDSIFKKSVTECLRDLNIPFSSHVTEYVIAQDFV